MMKKRYFSSVLLGLAAAAMAVGPASQALAEMPSPRAALAVTLDPGSDSSLQYRCFKFYRIFSIPAGATEQTALYSFDPNTKAAVQAFVGREINKTPANVTVMEAAEYLSSLLEGNTDANGISTPISKATLKLKELRLELNKSNASPQPSITFAAQPNGQAYTLPNIPEGYYLIDEDTNDAKATTPSSHVIARLITRNTTIQLKNTGVPVLQKQIFEDDNGIGWNDIADADRGQIVPYRSTFNIPQISGYDNYQVTYQDKLDSHFIFNPASVRVQIIEGSTTKTLTSGKDFTVNAAGSAEETFSVHIPDLKAVVDRDFYSGQSNEMHPYGQRVVIEYSARMSESQAIVPGRPGMENAGRLKYPHDPERLDKFAYTPWDSVVAFTFGLNFTKQNSDTKAPIQDVQFRLYRDQAATQEVCFKKESDQYRVVHPDAIQTGAVTDSGPLITDTQGKIQVVGLDQGTYYLKEIAGPAGYYPLTDLIKVTIVPEYTANRNSYIAGQGAGSQVLIGIKGTGNIVKYGTLADKLVGLETINITGDPTKGALEYTVFNKPIQKMPLTGSQSTMAALGMGGLLTMVGVRGLKGRRKK